jgi:MFS family permease
MTEPNSSTKPEKILDLEEVTDEEKSQEFEVPDGGYGWVVVFGCICTNMAAASTGAYSIYLAHYLEHSTFDNATKLDFATIGGIQLGAGFALAPFIGIFNQRFGARLTTALGGFLLFIGYFLSGFAKRLWQLYLTQGLIIGLGYGFIFVPPYALVPQWFRKKRAWAVSLTTTGAGWSGILFNLSTQAIIKNLGLRWAYIIQAIECAVLCGIGVALIRTRDQHIRPDRPKIVDPVIGKHPIFWIFTCYVFLTFQGYAVLLLSIADFTKTLGFSSQQASIASCMVSIGFIFGRAAVGRASDYFGVVTTGIAVYTIVGIFCLAMWIPIRNYASVLIFALIQGLLSGSIWVSLSPITSRLFGLKKLRNLLNMIWITVGISSIVAPIIGLKLRGSPNGAAQYSPSQYVNTAIYCGVSYFAGVIFLWIIRAYLIARDEILENEQATHTDTDVLYVQISCYKIFKSLFKMKLNRLV